MSNSLEEFLTQTEFFDSLTASEAIEVLQISKKVKFPRGLEIVKEGEDGETFYLITDGRAEIIMDDQMSSGNEIKLATLNQSQVFGEMALLGKKRRQATVKAYTDIELLEWTKKDIEELFNDKPKIGVKIFRNLAKIMSDRLMDMNLKLRNTPDFSNHVGNSGFLAI